jgi:hypothetical protein
LTPRENEKERGKSESIVWECSLSRVYQVQGYILCLVQRGKRKEPKPMPKYKEMTCDIIGEKGERV